MTQQHQDMSSTFSLCPDRCGSIPPPTAAQACLHHHSCRTVTASSHPGPPKTDQSCSPARGLLGPLSCPEDRLLPLWHGRQTRPLESDAPPPSLTCPLPLPTQLPLSLGCFLLLLRGDSPAPKPGCLKWVFPCGGGATSVLIHRHPQISLET